MIRHRVKALRLAPERLHERMDLLWKLSHLPDQPFERPRRRGAEDPHELPGSARRAAGQEGQARADHPGMGEQRAYPGEQPAAS